MEKRYVIDSKWPGIVVDRAVGMIVCFCDKWGNAQMIADALNEAYAEKAESAWDDTLSRQAELEALALREVRAAGEARL